MDVALEFLDEHLFDKIYAQFLPNTNSTNGSVDAFTSVLPRDNNRRLVSRILCFLTMKQ